MWIGLVFVACLATGEATPIATETTARQCREVELPFEGSLMQCMLMGQQGIVGWLAQNERYELTGGYKCMTGKPA
jgi:hypothetical protein